MTDTQTELMGLLKELASEYGGQSLEDGVYHVALNPTTSKPVKNAYRLGWKIICGASKGREAGDFVRWFSDQGEEATNSNRGIFRGKLAALVKNYEVGDADLAAAVRALRASQTVPESQDAFGAFAGAIAGLPIYVQVYTRENSDMQSVRIVGRDDRRASCECVLAGIRV